MAQSQDCKITVHKTKHYKLKHIIENRKIKQGDNIKYKSVAMTGTNE